MTEATLGIGGNLGDPVAAFAEALRQLGTHPRIRLGALSRIYRTAPWGMVDQPDFLNMAAVVETGLDAGDLLSYCLLIETTSGRIRRDRWGPRTLDIDLLTFGDAIIDQAGLQVPHPRMTERAFVMVPLAEVAPGLPVGGRPAGAWAEAIGAAGVAADDVATARLRRLVG